MKTIRLKTHVEADGSLKIHLPDYSDEEVELLVVYQSIKEIPKRRWSQNFLDLFGAFENDPLERAPQEMQPERNELR